jgi:outer membrane murein-binding lipoprotein Lpp
MFIRHIIAVAASVLALSGCYSKDQLDAKLRTQASTELECPEDKLSVYETSDATRIVNGCGKKRSYLGVCAHFRCGWIENDGDTVAKFFIANTRPVPTFKSSAPTAAPIWRSAPPARR